MVQTPLDIYGIVVLHQWRVQSLTIIQVERQEHIIQRYKELDILWARLCDNAGNCTMTSSGGFRIDNTAPTISAMTCSYHTVSQVFRVNFNASSLSGIARYSARFDNVTRSSTTSSTLSWNIPSSSAPAGSVTVREIQIRNNTGLETNTSMVCTVTHFSN